MGFVMAIFMNAVEYREIEFGRNKMPARMVLRVVVHPLPQERLLSDALHEQRLCHVWLLLLHIRVPNGEHAAQG